jgi:hypothetical protein
MAKVILTFKSYAMKSYLPILSLALLFASCTTAYKSGQTPDDVYFSPTRPQDEYVRTEKKQDRYYGDDDVYRDDRYLRMRVHNRRWTTLDDNYYSYNPYYTPYYNNYIYNSSWSPYTYWNYMYNPYYTNVIVVTPSNPVYNKPRTYNLHVFDQNPSTSTTPTHGFGSENTYRGSTNNNNNYNNSGTNAGSFIRNVFGSSGSSESSRPTSTPSSSSSGSSSSGSSSSGSSSAPVRRF